MNILSIDDQPLFREGLHAVLSQLGGTLCFSHIAKLSDITREAIYGVNLILLDLGVEGSKGLQCLARLIELNPTGCIFVISGEDEPEIIQQCINGGVVGFILKTAEPDALIAAIRTVLAGGTYIPAGLQKGPTVANDEEQAFALSTLTPRQRMALLLAGRGLPNKSIASKMGIVEGTVKLHLSAAFKLLGVKNRTEAVFVMSRSQPSIY